MSFTIIKRDSPMFSDLLESVMPLIDKDAMEQLIRSELRGFKVDLLTNSISLHFRQDWGKNYEFKKGTQNDCK